MKRKVKRLIKDFVKKLCGQNPRLIARLYASWQGLNGVPLATDSAVLAEFIGARDNNSRVLRGTHGINLLGYLSGEFGLAESARAFAHALDTGQLAHVLNNVKMGGHSYADTTLTNFSMDNPYFVNLITANTDMLAAVSKEKGREYFADKYNVGLWYWETPHFPKYWWSHFSLLDEVWVTSDFCAAAISKVSPIPVAKITYPFQVRQPKPHFNKQHFGIDPQNFAFVFSFDFFSVFERKNPLAVIEAFRRAFRSDDQVILVLKANNTQGNPHLVELMHKTAQGLEIQIIAERLKHEEVLGLFAACDCLVSLHRSEGLGLGMAEAMSLGKPVIATAYSGNMEFMNVNNSFLVKYDLIELKKDYGPYAKGDVWADADIEHAAYLMRYAYQNQEEARNIGARAAQDIRTQLNPSMTARDIEARLKLVSQMFPSVQ